MERFWIFLVILIGLAMAEAFWPRRERGLTRLQRWPGAILLLGIGMILGRLLLPVGLAGIALFAEANSFGLFNQINAPLVIVIVIGFLIMDFAVWAQHVAMHYVPFFWRFHRVHHADPDFDVTTALRFHPGEILLSLIWKGAIVVLLGLPAWLALAFEVVLSSSAMFNHSNLALPKSVDKILRWIIVTPDMHRVHHSTTESETNTNFGFFLPWWDRIFNVYRAQPKAGHKGMEIGQHRWRSAEEQSLWSLLLQPRQSS